MRKAKLRSQTPPALCRVSWIRIFIFFCAIILTLTLSSITYYRGVPVENRPSRDTSVSTPSSTNITHNQNIRRLRTSSRQLCVRRLRSNSTPNVRVISSSALMLSAGALLWSVVASLLRQNHRAPPLRQSFFRRARGARRDTVWRFSGGLDISQKRTFPIQLKCIFCTHHTMVWPK